MGLDAAIREWPEELTPSLSPGAGDRATDVVYASRGNVRAELERASWPAGPWWRARVVGGRRWHVPTLLPWSYGASENAALDAALTLWVRAGHPGLEDAIPEPRSSMRWPEARLTLAARDSWANATIVIVQPDVEVEEYQVTQTVQGTVRVLATALDEGVSTLALESEAGPTLSVPVSSVVEVRGPRSEDRRVEDRAVVEGPSEPARAGRSASPEAPAPGGPASRGAAPERPARSG